MGHVRQGRLLPLPSGKAAFQLALSLEGITQCIGCVHYDLAPDKCRLLASCRH
jgi:hypothetical protein